MTIKEFAALAGVSVSTVSKIMNNKDSSISEETRERVLNLAKEYHYKPNSPSLNPDFKTLTIGVLLKDPDISNAALAGMLSEASKRGYSLLIRHSNNSTEQELKNFNAILSANVDGIIWEPTSQSELTYYANLLDKEEIPYVFLTYSQLEGHGEPAIDFQRLSHYATSQLIQHGHNEIACYLVDGVRSEGFYQGYRQCLFDNNILFNQQLLFRDEDSLINKIVSHSFSSVVVSHYSAALRLLRRLQDLHYFVPHDLSIISLKNSAQFPDTSLMPISAIPIPYFEYGINITDYLINIIEKKAVTTPLEPIPELDSQASIGLPYRLHSKQVISVGSINVDTYLTFENLPTSGTPTTSSSLSVYPGGKGLNQAVGAAKLGIDVAIIGRVGNDTDSDYIYDYIKDFNINSDGVRRTKEKKTGQAYIFVQKNGESMISLMAGANQAMTAEDILKNEYLFANGGYCLLQTEIAMDATIEAAKLAKKHRMTTVLKPSARDYLPEELLHYTDIIVPNLKELNQILGEHGTLDEKADSLLSCGIKTIIITLGTEGFYIKSKDIQAQFPAIEVTSVDVSGAGDAFISALVAYLIYGYDILTASQIANYAAGLSTTRQGTAPVLVDKNTLESYIQIMNPELLM